MEELIRKMRPTQFKTRKLISENHYNSWALAQNDRKGRSCFFFFITRLHGVDLQWTESGNCELTLYGTLKTYALYSYSDRWYTRTTFNSKTSNMLCNTCGFFVEEKLLWNFIPALAQSLLALMRGNLMSPRSCLAINLSPLITRSALFRG